MVYDAKLDKKNFENFFLTDTLNFELNFSYYANIALSPNLFYIDNEKGGKILIEESEKTSKGMFNTHIWNKSHGIKIKDMIRLEW